MRSVLTLSILTETVVSRRCLLVENSVIWDAVCRQKYIDG